MSPLRARHPRLLLTTDSNIPKTALDNICFSKLNALDWGEKKRSFLSSILHRLSRMSAAGLMDTSDSVVSNSADADEMRIDATVSSNFHLIAVGDMVMDAGSRTCEWPADWKRVAFKGSLRSSSLPHLGPTARGKMLIKKPVNQRVRFVTGYRFVEASRQLPPEISTLYIRSCRFWHVLCIPECTAKNTKYNLERRER